MRIFSSLALAFAIGILAAPAVQAGPLGLLGNNKKEQQNQIKSGFQTFHYDKDADWERLKKIQILTVDFSALPPSPAWQTAAKEIAPRLQTDAATLAEGMRKSFCDEIKARASKSWATTDAADDETAILQLSLTRLVPPSAAPNAEAPSVSFEGKLTDKKTGKVVMSFSETQSYSANLGGVWYGNCPQIMAQWADKFAEMSMPDPDKAQEKSKLRKIARMVGFHFAIRKFMD